MGFRSTFVTDSYDIKWPRWFINKWKDVIWFNKNCKGVLASKKEAKVYDRWEKLPSDIQKAINWDEFRVGRFILVFLHECGGITRCQIERDVIKWSEPETWRITNDIAISVLIYEGG